MRSAPALSARCNPRRRPALRTLADDGCRAPRPYGRGCTRGRRHEIKEQLERLGLRLSMTLPGGPISIVDEGVGTMVWGKRRFKGVDYVPYFDRFEKLLLANGAQYREFIMVSTKTDEPLVDDFYIGVPNEAFLMLFDGFEKIREAISLRRSTPCISPTRQRRSSTLDLRSQRNWDRSPSSKYNMGLARRSNQAKRGLSI